MPEPRPGRARTRATGHRIRGILRGLLVAGAVVFVVVMWQRGQAAPGNVSEFPAVGSPLPAVEPSITSSPVTPALVTTGCDEIDQLFARMFVGLTQAALTESGTEPAAFAAAMAHDRETLRRYFEVLGVPVDDAWIDAVMSPDLDQRLLDRCLDGTGDAQPSGG